MTQSKIKISVLREIGWRFWDPIGLREDDGRPPEGAEDEYDSYMLKAAGMLVNGKGTTATVEYLEHVKRDLMGLESSNFESLEKVVHEIKMHLMELGYEVP